MAKGKGSKKRTDLEKTMAANRTRAAKMRKLNRHILRHPNDVCGPKALKRWDENPPNGAK